MKHALKTHRLNISPCTDMQMKALIDSQVDLSMKQAYLEMLAGCQTHPELRHWYTAWQILLRDGTFVGDFCFKGPPNQSEVEIGYGIIPEFQKQGYATEAISAAVLWAFEQPNVVYVTAETIADNLASRHLLEKLGFTPYGMGIEGPRFEKEKPFSQWMLLYMVLGMGLGASLGAAGGNVGLSISLGLCLGLALGAGLDHAEKTNREKLRTARAHVISHPTDPTV